MQLPSPRLRVNVEYCKSCDTHTWCTHHDQQKYFNTFQKLKQYLQKQFESQVIVQGNILPQQLIPIKPAQNKYYSQKTNKYVQFPVIGAFQITIDGEVVFSKKKTNTWPILSDIGDKVYFRIYGSQRPHKSVDSKKSPSKQKNSPNAKKQQRACTAEGDIRTQKDNWSQNNNKSFLDNNDKRSTFYKPKSNYKNFTLTDHFKNYHNRDYKHPINSTNMNRDSQQFFTSNQTEYDQQNMSSEISSFRQRQSSERQFLEFKKNFDVWTNKQSKSKLSQLLKRKGQIKQDGLGGKKQMIIRLDSIEEQSILVDENLLASNQGQNNHAAPSIFNNTHTTFKSRQPKQNTHKQIMRKFNDDFEQLQEKFKNFQQKVENIREQNKKFDYNRDKKYLNRQSMPKIMNQKVFRQIKQANKKDRRLKSSEAKNYTEDDSFEQQDIANNPIIFAKRKLKNIEDYINGTQQEKNQKLKKIYGEWKLFRKPYKAKNYISPYRLDLINRIGTGQTNQKNPRRKKDQIKHYKEEESSEDSSLDSSKVRQIESKQAKFAIQQSKIPRIPPMPPGKSPKQKQMMIQQQFYSSSRGEFQQIGTKKLSKKSSQINTRSSEQLKKTQNQFHRAATGVKINTVDQIRQMDQKPSQAWSDKKQDFPKTFIRSKQKVIKNGRILKSIEKSSGQSHINTQKNFTKIRKISKSQKNLNNFPFKKDQFNFQQKQQSKLQNDQFIASGHSNNSQKAFKNFRSKKNPNVSKSKGKQVIPKQQEKGRKKSNQLHSNQQSQQNISFQESHNNSQSLQNNFFVQNPSKKSQNHNLQKGSRVKKGYEKDIGQNKEWKQCNFNQKQIKGTDLYQDRKEKSKNKGKQLQWKKSAEFEQKQLKNTFTQQNDKQNNESSSMISSQKKLQKKSKHQREKALQRQKSKRQKTENDEASIKQIKEASDKKSNDKREMKRKEKKHERIVELKDLNRSQDEQGKFEQSEQNQVDQLSQDQAVEIQDDILQKESENEDNKNDSKTLAKIKGSKKPQKSKKNNGQMKKQQKQQNKQKIFIQSKEQQDDDIKKTQRKIKNKKKKQTSQSSEKNKQKTKQNKITSQQNKQSKKKFRNQQNTENNENIDNLSQSQEIEIKSSQNQSQNQQFQESKGQFIQSKQQTLKGDKKIKQKLDKLQQKAKHIESKKDKNNQKSKAKDNKNKNKQRNNSDEQKESEKESQENENSSQNIENQCQDLQENQQLKNKVINKTNVKKSQKNHKESTQSKTKKDLIKDRNQREKGNQSKQSQNQQKSSQVEQQENNQCQQNQKLQQESQQLQQESQQLQQESQQLQQESQQLQQESQQLQQDNDDKNGKAKPKNVKKSNALKNDLNIVQKKKVKKDGKQISYQNNSEVKQGQKLNQNVSAEQNEQSSESEKDQQQIESGDQTNQKNMQENQDHDQDKKTQSKKLNQQKRLKDQLNKNKKQKDSIQADSQQLTKSNKKHKKQHQQKNLSQQQSNQDVSIQQSVSQENTLLSPLSPQKMQIKTVRKPKPSKSIHQTQNKEKSQIQKQKQKNSEIESQLSQDQILQVSNQKNLRKNTQNNQVNIKQKNSKENSSTKKDKVSKTTIKNSKNQQSQQSNAESGRNSQQQTQKENNQTQKGKVEKKQNKKKDENALVENSTESVLKQQQNQTEQNKSKQVSQTNQEQKQNKQSIKQKKQIEINKKSLKQETSRSLLGAEDKTQRLNTARSVRAKNKIIGIYNANDKDSQEENDENLEKQIENKEEQNIKQKGQNQNEELKGESQQETCMKENEQKIDQLKEKEKSQKRKINESNVDLSDEDKVGYQQSKPTNNNNIQEFELTKKREYRDIGIQMQGLQISKYGKDQKDINDLGNKKISLKDQKDIEQSTNLTKQNPNKIEVSKKNKKQKNDQKRQHSQQQQWEAQNRSLQQNEKLQKQESQSHENLGKQDKDEVSLQPQCIENSPKLNSKKHKSSTESKERENLINRSPQKSIIRKLDIQTQQQPQLEFQKNQLIAQQGEKQQIKQQKNQQKEKQQRKKQQREKQQNSIDDKNVSEKNQVDDVEDLQQQEGVNQQNQNQQQQNQDQQSNQEENTKTVRAPITRQFYGESFNQQIKLYPSLTSKQTQQQNFSSLSNFNQTIPQNSYISQLPPNIVSKNSRLFNTKSIEVHKLISDHPLPNLMKCLKILADINEFLIIRLFENPSMKITKKNILNKKFGVWLCVNYDWKCIIIDLNQILLSQQNEKEQREPFYLHHSNNQLWPIVLETALAKALKSYKLLASLPCHKLFNILTGSNSLFFNIKQDPSKNSRILRYITDCQNKNFILHAEKVCKNLDELQKSQKQTKIYYVLSQKIVNCNFLIKQENQILMQIRESIRPDSQWMKLTKFVQQFKSIEILQLRLNHNFSSIKLPKPMNTSNLTIIQLQFLQESFGSITLATSEGQLCPLLKTYLYKQEKSNVLKLVGQAKQKNKATLFFDCFFGETRYYLFVESTVQSRVTYLGENQPLIKIVQEINSDGLRNDYTEYLPIKTMNTTVAKMGTKEFGESSMNFKMPNKLNKSRFGETGLSFKSQQDEKISRLRENFVEYLLKGKE